MNKMIKMLSLAMLMSSVVLVNAGGNGADSDAQDPQTENQDQMQPGTDNKQDQDKNDQKGDGFFVKVKSGAKKFFIPFDYSVDYRDKEARSKDQGFVERNLSECMISTELNKDNRYPIKGCYRWGAVGLCYVSVFALGTLIARTIAKHMKKEDAKAKTVIIDFDDEDEDLG